MRPIKVGQAEIRRVEESREKFPIAALTTDVAFLAENETWLRPNFVDADDNWDVIYQSWIMPLDGKIIVVDPCVGNGRNFPVLPSFHMLDTLFTERFEATGAKPEDVDFVFCTHLHSDHCGWNTQLRAGRYVPTFPNARYVMARREYERWDPCRPGHRAVEANAGVFEASVQPVMEAGLIDLVGERHQIASGLMVEPAYGHTNGHSVLHLTSDAQEAYFTGDAFHHPLEIVRPEIDLSDASEDVAATIATRRHLIEQLIERNALMIPAHFAEPHAGWVRRRDGIITFDALAP